MLQYWSEPSLADALSDPVVQAVMAADAVDPIALSALLREAARKLEADCRPSRSAGTIPATMLASREISATRS